MAVPPNAPFVVFAVEPHVDEYDQRAQGAEVNYQALLRHPTVHRLHQADVPASLEGMYIALMGRPFISP
jgi:hypothetical protein